MNRLPRIAAVAAVMTLLAACGAKGPLFLPEKPAEEESLLLDEVPATDVPATDEDAPVDDVPADTTPDAAGTTGDADGNG